MWHHNWPINKEKQKAEKHFNQSDQSGNKQVKGNI